MMQTLDWLGVALAVAGVVWTLVRTVHVRVNVRVREIDEPASDPAEQKFTFEGHAKLEHGGPIRFGTRSSPPA